MLLYSVLLYQKEKMSALQARDVCVKMNII